MERGTAPLESARAIGRLEAGGLWIGFGFRARTGRIVVGVGDQMRDVAADQDELLALAIAHFTGALEEAPPDLEATQSDLSGLVRYLMNAEADEIRHVLLAEAVDAIDDGLAGDAVAERLQAARSAQGDSIDPVELLARLAKEVAARG
jgi:hypothetical protein